MSNLDRLYNDTNDKFQEVVKIFQAICSEFADIKDRLKKLEAQAIKADLRGEKCCGKTGSHDPDCPIITRFNFPNDKPETKAVDLSEKDITNLIYILEGFRDNVCVEGSEGYNMAKDLLKKLK